MTPQIKNTSLDKFLTLLMGSREVGLLIAKDVKELEYFVQLMGDVGFDRSEKISDLVKFKKTYFTIPDGAQKDIYDFVIQYPTGSVDMFNHESMQSQKLFPDYLNSGIVLLVTKEYLYAMQKRGFNFLSITGPTYQSEL